MNDAIHTEIHNGFKIEIFNDTDAANPLIDWDYFDDNVQYRINHGRDYVIESDDFECPTLTREQIKNNLTRITELFTYTTFYNFFGGRKSNGTLLNGLTCACDDYRQAYGNDAIGYINYCISVVWRCGDDSDRVAICEIAGLVAIEGSRTGHVQGQAIEFMAYSTKNDVNDKSFDDYAAYCFGDVYGYVVSRLGCCEDCRESSEEIDSCWGFYGEYMSEGWEHMLSEARAKTEDEKPSLWYANDICITDYEDSHDTEAMEADNYNGNFSIDRISEYAHEKIVQASIVNGQHKQAIEQAARYGMDYAAQCQLLKMEAVQ